MSVAGVAEKREDEGEVVVDLSACEVGAWGGLGWRCEWRR
jgi:hypothetical protein